MRRGCRGFQDMPLPDWHAVAVHRARSSALPPRVCGCWSIRVRWWSQNLKKAPVPRNLHAPMQIARSADGIPRNSGRGWPVGRATHSGTACGHHARGNRPCPLCRTTCPPAIRKCDGRSRQATGWDEFGQTGTCEFLSMQSGPLISVPLLSQRQTFAAFLQAHVLFMFSLDSNQWSTNRDDLPQSSDRASGRLSGDGRDILTASPRPGFHLVRARDRSAEDRPASGKAISSCKLPGRASRSFLPGGPVYGGDSRGRAPVRASDQPASCTHLGRIPLQSDGC